MQKDDAHLIYLVRAAAAPLTATSVPMQRSNDADDDDVVTY